MQAEPMRRHVTVERSLLICFVPRSGSWFLAGLLASTGAAGRPAEFFWPRGEEEARAVNRLRTDEEHLEWVLGEGANLNGSFGCKFQWGELQDVLGRLRQMRGADLPETRLLADAFPNPSYVWLRRRDIVAQAVSWARALQTNQWRACDPAHVEPRFDFDQIAGLRRLIEDEDTAWAGWFKVNGIDTEQVFYEDLLADPRRELSRIVASLGLDLPTGVDLRPYPGYERQADAVSFEWCSRYRDQSSQNTLTEQAR